MSIPKVIANFVTTLSDKLEKGGTSFAVVSIDHKHGTAANGLYGVTIDEGTGDEEHIIGVLDAATKTFSSLIRDVSVVDGKTTSSTGKKHRKGAEVKITDHPSLVQIVNILNGTAKLDSTNGAVGYDGAPAAFTDNDLITKKYVADNYVGVNENDEVEGDLTFNGDNTHNGQNTFQEKVQANGGLESVTPIQAADPVNSNDLATKAFVLAQAFGSLLISGINSPELNYDQNGRLRSLHDVDNGKTYVFIYRGDGRLDAIFDGTSTWSVRYKSNDDVLSISKH